MALFYSASFSPNANALSIRYDLSLRHWGQFYFPYQDWHWGKAQAAAESNLNPDARSYCGAVGLFQLMPSTAKGLKVNPYDPEQNIMGGIRYDRQLWRIWRGIKDPGARHDFTFASYNAGPGWIIKALRKIHGAQSWAPVGAALPAVTGPGNARQTNSYIAHIRAFYKRFTGQ